MPEGVYVYLQGFRQTRDKLGRFSFAVDEEAQSILDDAGKLALEIAQDNAPKDLGAGAQHMHLQSQPLAVGAYSVALIAPDKYMVVQEYGRAAGRKPPPWKSLVGWAGRHAASTNIRRTAFVIAQSIGKKGFRGKFFMKKASEEADLYVRRRLARAGARIAKFW